jgi:hypothetical protein
LTRESALVPLLDTGLGSSQPASTGAARICGGWRRRDGTAGKHVSDEHAMDDDHDRHAAAQVDSETSASVESVDRRALRPGAA